MKLRMYKGVNMLVTKEVLQWLKKADQIVFLRKTDDNVYMISDQNIHNRSVETSCNEIECNERELYHASFSRFESNIIWTVIEQLRVNDRLKIKISKHGIDDLILYDVLLYVERPYRNRFIDYTYLLNTTSVKYLA
jgi:hypothetical protein